MLLFQDRDPMEDLIDIIVKSNPDLDGIINPTNITLEYVVAQSTAEETATGFNTRAMLFGIGDMADVVGTRYIYWNRIDLNSIFPDNMLRVRAASLSGTVLSASITTALAKALGTAINRVGLFVDIAAPANRSLGSGLTYSGYTVYPNEYSLRYKPGSFRFVLESLGDSLSAVITTQEVYPFYDQNALTINIDGFNSRTNLRPRLVDEVKRSYYQTMGRIDWANVWGSDFTSVIEDNPDGGYMFTAGGFAKINAILEVYGLPALPDKYFANYDISGTSKKAWYSSARADERDYRVRIYNDDLSYDYYALANLSSESIIGQNSSTYGPTPDTGLILQY